MIKYHSTLPEIAEAVRGGEGTVQAHKLIDLFPEVPSKVLALFAWNGASVGAHSHHAEEDFYYCISGEGIVVDNGVEQPFTPGMLQITRSGETQAIKNTGETELVFLAPSSPPWMQVKAAMALGSLLNRYALVAAVARPRPLNVPRRQVHTPRQQSQSIQVFLASTVDSDR